MPPTSARVTRGHSPSTFAAAMRSYPESKSSWRLPFFGGYKFQSQPGVSNLDGAAFYYFFATGVTPAMEEKMVGRGSQYPWTALDADGKPFDGGKTYKLTLRRTCRSGISGRSSSMTSRPARCCRPTRVPQRIQPEQGCEGQRRRLGRCLFGPVAPEARRQLGPDDSRQGWFTILRLYGPLEPWFDKTWRPGEIELQK